MVIGDWGRQDLYHTAALANVMAGVTTRVGARFVVSTGDNGACHLCAVRRAHAGSHARPVMYGSIRQRA